MSREEDLIALAEFFQERNLDAPTTIAVLAQLAAHLCVEAGADTEMRRRNAQTFAGMVVNRVDELIGSSPDARPN